MAQENNNRQQNNPLKFKSVKTEKDIPTAPDLPIGSPAQGGAGKSVQAGRLSLNRHNDINREFFTQEIMLKKGFAEKKSDTGLIVNRNMAGLFAPHFDMEFSYRLARCEMYRDDGIFQVQTSEQLLEFLESCYPDLNPEFYKILNEASDEFASIKTDLQQAFRTNQTNEYTFVGMVEDIVYNAATEVKREGGKFHVVYSNKKMLLGLGIVARPSEPESQHLLDTASGFLGKCKSIFDPSDKNFAVFEAKLIRPESGKLWYTQGGNLALQLYNSFIGGEAQIGFALVLGGIHVIWKKQDAGEKVYNFYTLSREFIEVNRKNEWTFFTKVFIHVARICSQFVENQVFLEAPASPQRTTANSLEPDTVERHYQAEQRRRIRDEEFNSPCPKRTRENMDRVLSDSDESIAPTKEPVISWSRVYNPSGEDLVFGAVKLSEFLSEQELEELLDQEFVAGNPDFFRDNQQTS
jgi:hypothetical protein